MALPFVGAERERPKEGAAAAEMELMSTNEDSKAEYMHVVVRGMNLNGLFPPPICFVTPVPHFWLRMKSANLNPSSEDALLHYIECVIFFFGTNESRLPLQSEAKEGYIQKPQPRHSIKVTSRDQPNLHRILLLSVVVP